MAIRKRVDYDKHADKSVGMVDVGDGKPHEDLATEVMVVMAVGLLGTWKMPIAYFCLGKWSSGFLTDVLRQSLVRLHEVGIRAMAITFDGCSKNLAAMKDFGCEFGEKVVNSFPHPSNPALRVYAFPDPPHMLKLVRNMLGDWKIFYTQSGILLWELFVNLDSYQCKEGVSGGNKLSKRHIGFHTQIMKVYYKFYMLIILI